MAIILGEHDRAYAWLDQSADLWRATKDICGLALCLSTLCLIAYFQRQYALARRYGEESVALCRRVGHKWHWALALDNLAYAVAAQGDLPHARALFEEEVVLFTELGDQWGLAGAIVGLGYVAGSQGDHGAARLHLERALAIRRAYADRWTLCESLDLLAEILQQQGEFEQASRYYCECLLLSREIGDKAGMAHVCSLLGKLAQSIEDYGQAARLLAFGATLGNFRGGVAYHTLADPNERERLIAALRVHLGAEGFAAHWAVGQAMTLEQIVQYAMSVAGSVEVRPRNLQSGLKTVPGEYGALTAREHEVLQLLVQGLSYAKIADTLMISRRTVNSHLTTIYGKIGVNSRAAAMHYVLQHGM
jgi:DNA-binding CsgD family transcriptional regulator/tetratricopeptide (TPR) repeat protein